MKKTLAIAVLGLFLLTNLSLAQELPITNPEDLPGAQLCGQGTTVQECVTQIFQIVFRALIYVAGAFAVIEFVWAGITMILHPDKAGDAKTRIIYGAVGLVVALISYIAVKLLERFTIGGTLQ